MYQEDALPHPNERATRWLRRLVQAGRFLLFLLIVPCVLLAFRQPLSQQRLMADKLERMKRERDALRDQRDKLVRRMDWIKNDIEYLEIQARDRFNMQKDGEFVLRLDD